MVDSHIVFILGTPFVGYWACKKDGLGLFPEGSSTKSTFTRGVAGASGVTGYVQFSKHGRRNAFRPLAEQFVSVALPLAKARGVDSHTVFRRVWDQFTIALRESDLISNEEQIKLMYGDGVLGVDNRLPLFMYAGKVRRALRRSNKIAQIAATAQSDDEFRYAAFPDEATEAAIMEIVHSLPYVLTHIAQSHSAIGFSDPHVENTFHRAFGPYEGKTIAESVSIFLHQPSKPERPAPTPREILRELAGLIAQVMVAFERSDASTRLRGSPLLDITIKFLLRYLELREGGYRNYMIGLYGSGWERVMGDDDLPVIPPPKPVTEGGAAEGMDGGTDGQGAAANLPSAVPGTSRNADAGPMATLGSLAGFSTGDGLQSSGAHGGANGLSLDAPNLDAIALAALHGRTASMVGVDDAQVREYTQNLAAQALARKNAGGTGDAARDLSVAAGTAAPPTPIRGMEGGTPAVNNSPYSNTPNSNGVGTPDLNTDGGSDAYAMGMGGSMNANVGAESYTTAIDQGYAIALAMGDLMAAQHRRNGTDGQVDSRSLKGVIALLNTPNENSGRLDCDGDPDISDRLDSLKGK